MEYEIIEPLDCGSWAEDWCHSGKSPMRAIDRDDMQVRAMEIPESDEV